MLGPDGLTKATKHAILNANYIAARLKDKYKILYTESEWQSCSWAYRRSAPL